MEAEGAQPFPLPSPPIGFPSALHRLLKAGALRRLFFFATFARLALPPLPVRRPWGIGCWCRIL